MPLRSVACSLGLVGLAFSWCCVGWSRTLSPEISSSYLSPLPSQYHHHPDPGPPHFAKQYRYVDAAAEIPPASAPAPSFLRGVNVGGWLVLEKWISPELFTGLSAEDQWTFDGLPDAPRRLQGHWRTWFTERDVQWLQQTGINALRIPIGFWAYDNAGTPYQMGADAYLEQAIFWARKAGMKVWIDIHGLPGSQNGFDNSGHNGHVGWQTDANLRRSIAVLQTVARKYGAMDYADTVVGLELVNEPISWGNNNIQITRRFAVQAYHAVKAQVTNPYLMIIMHDSFKGASAWKDIAPYTSTTRLFGVDSHLYRCFVAADSTKTQDEHVQYACGWAKELRDANAVLPTFVGEWSPVTNICAHPDGSTTPGSSCAIAGCQCSNTDVSSWQPPLVRQVRRYVEAQLDTFESSTSGYFMWSYKGPGAWSFVNGVQRGFIPVPLDSRRTSSSPCGRSA